MSANKDFLPSSSPVSSICAIEIIAILFLFVMNCYKSSFQECITIIVLKDDRTTNQPPRCLLQLQESVIPPPPVRLSWDSRHPPPESVRTDGWTLDCEQSLFCSKIPAGGAARKASTIFEPRAASREPRAASSVGGRVSEERKERLPCFHTAFLKPGTLVTECFDWSVYDPMARICHHHLKTCSARQRLPSIELLTARHQTHSFKRSYSHI